MIKVKREPLLATREYWKSTWLQTILFRIGKIFITIKWGDDQ